MIILTIFQLILKELLRWRLVTLFFHWHYHLQLFQTQARVGLCPHGAAGMSGREGQKCHRRPNMSGWGGWEGTPLKCKFKLWGGRQQTREMIFTEGGCLASQPGQHWAAAKTSSGLGSNYRIELMKLNESKYNVRTTWGWPHTSPHRIPGCTQGWGEQLTT